MGLEVDWSVQASGDRAPMCNGSSSMLKYRYSAKVVSEGDQPDQEFDGDQLGVAMVRCCRL